MQQVASAIGDAAVVVPGAAGEEVGDVGEDAGFDALVEDDGVEGAFATGLAECFPGGAAGGVDDGFALGGLLGEVVGFGEEGFEDVAVGVEGGERDGFPGFAHLEVHGFGLANSVYHQEGVFVPDDVLAGAGDERKVGVYGAVGVLDLLGRDG